MNSIFFATGNDEKFAIADAYCRKYGVALEQAALDIAEIQSTNPESIAVDKAHKAYQKLGAPVIVSDDYWVIHALNGFPGAFMRYIDDWLTTDDILRLLQPYDDRSGTLTSTVTFADGHTTQTFQHNHPFIVLPEARGDYGKPLQKLLSLPEDNGLSVAEVYDAKTHDHERPAGAAWEQLCAWLTTQNQPSH